MSACFVFASPDARRSAWPSRRPRVLQAPPIHPLRMYPFATLRNDFSPESSSCCAITSSLGTDSDSSQGVTSPPSVTCFFDAEEESVMVMERCTGLEQQQRQQHDTFFSAKIADLAGGGGRGIAAAVAVWPGGGGFCLLLRHERYLGVE